MAERSVDAYARILSRVEPRELQEQCQRVVRRDAKRTLRKLTQLQGALQRLQEVDAATRRLLAPAQNGSDSNSNILAQLSEILALRERLMSALDALTQFPPSASDRVKMETGLEKQPLATAPGEDADKREQLVQKRKVVPQVDDSPLSLPSADKCALLIKQEDVTTTKTMEVERQCAGAQPVTRRRYSAPIIDLSNESDDEVIQSHQFPFLIKKLQTHLYSRATRLESNETQEIAQAIEIAIEIGMSPGTVPPNDPALTDLLIAIRQFRALGADEVPVQFTEIANTFTAFLLPTAVAAASVALGDPYIVQHREGMVIRVDVLLTTCTEQKSISRLDNAAKDTIADRRAAIRRVQICQRHGTVSLHAAAADRDLSAQVANVLGFSNASSNESQPIEEISM